MCICSDQILINDTIYLDPEASVKFYKQLGMSVLQEFRFPDFKLDLYFLAYDNQGSVSQGRHMSDREGVIELSYSYDVERIHNGNTDPKGFGHICVSVYDLESACDRLSKAGFHHQQSQHGFTYVLDPDEYWVKLISQNDAVTNPEPKTTNIEKYRFNHTMLRVKDKNASLEYYQNVFGMTLHHTHHNLDQNYESFFLGYCKPKLGKEVSEPNPDPLQETLLELVYIPGSEEHVQYHNGNTDPEGFGHICVSVDDIQEACKRFEEKGVRWHKRLEDGPFRIAFIQDPDDYWIEIIQNESYKPAGHNM
ncbi:hypothetical protein TrVFT333_009393 [Trichoderma virens FT-333]|nr:hypothetical protein TrVFT333_009393 [Trichoderma virens FT-333]